ncbi:sulfatase [Halorientalis pallida]|uniref:Sulfatase n=1 Tax=Halorientalis pallida TaxID=2479928 RepID=A0A498L3V0_9EURY|nr:sulfatase [Halorientalis pallida]RXK50474.1 sulfatase [Halorientalis pallida]
MTDLEAPNVVFVVLDTVRKSSLTPYGCERETTPTLSAFAEVATTYEQAVAPAPWTLPVHASMFTGLYPSEHGATQETPYLEGATTLAESLSAAGYETACFSANAWISPYTRLTAGFDHQDNFFRLMPGDALSGPLARLWTAMSGDDRLRSVTDWLVEAGNRVHERLAASASEDTKTPAVIDRTIEFVAETDGPFFAFLNLMDAHLPYHPPAAYAEAFAPGTDPSRVCQNAKDFNAGAREIDDAEWAEIVGLYEAEIRHMDDQLGRLFDWLRATGHWADTTVVVCADHGELHGEHGLYGHEFAVYDPLVNVPLTIKHPDLPAGGRDGTTTVELLDLYHTVLSAAGVEAAPGGVAVDPARSLLAPEYRSFDGHEAEPDVPERGRYAFVEYHRPVVELRQLESVAADAGLEIPEQSRFYSRMRAARRPDAKYVRNERIPDEGYRLDTDPGETTNVAGADEAVAAAASALTAFEDTIAAEWGTVEADDVLEDMDRATRDRLAELGYLD